MNIAWKSSYEKYNYGDVFYALVHTYRPEKVVELGTKEGYSAYHIARALSENGNGTLDCYDHDKAAMDRARENVKEFSPIVSFTTSDALGIDKQYKSIDILHVDLDNDADVLDEVVPAWINKVKHCIILEGGSVPRDELASKTNFRKMPVSKWLESINASSDELFASSAQSQDTMQQYVVVEGKSEYKEKPIAPWLTRLRQRFENIQYITLEPFPSLTIITKQP